MAAVDAEIASTWHPTRNGDVTPADVTRQSATKRWWICGTNPEHVWSESVQNRVNRRQCPECNKLARQGKLENALARSISENVSSYTTFADAIDSLSRLALLESPDAELQQVLYRQVYAGIVASMETYLSDTFINTVVGDKALRNRFARATADFADRKYKLDEVIDWERNSQTIIQKHLVDQVFHNLIRIGPLFMKVLKVKFPTEEKLAGLQRIINARHNIVHRNGRTKKGDVMSLAVPDIDFAISSVRELVESIDTQIARTPWKPRKASKPR
ncbi:zinc-ribbon domain-containing protein [Stieleria tagensis]|uniref:zinc-ribbon domain-containing protein n=1 Tax=Stieleria tagensis TaxID=2956795 RepID=UPI00209BA3F4|nr:zinc-ribbon domain-containing protein [Stieleria tagensis]